MLSGRCSHKITFAQMREQGVRGVLIYCSDYHCFALDTRFDADYWADDVRLSDIEPGFTCTDCGKRGADVRPDFNRNRKPVKVMGFR